MSALLLSRSARTIVRNGSLWSLLVLMLVSAGTALADQAQDEYDLAVQLYRQSRWAFATESFRKFLKDHPKHERAPLSRLYLGLTLINQSEYEAARTELRGFVKENPQNNNIAQARYRVAECSYLLNDLPAARSELQTFLKEHPKDSLAERAWPYLGDVHLRLGDAAAAAASFERAIDQFPQGALVEDAQFGWAKALDSLKKPEEARQKYEQLAAGKGPHAADALFQLASREFDASQFAAAAKLYMSLVERFPESPLVGDASLNAGFALYRGGQFAEAAKAFERARRDPQREVQADYWRALCLKSEGQPAQAAELLASLEPKSAQHPLAESILLQLAMCQRLAGNMAAATTALTTLLTRFPQGDLADDALYYSAELAIDEGQPAVARQHLDQLGKQFPKGGLVLPAELLRGRLELADAAALTGENDGASRQAHYAAAIASFNKVLQQSTVPRTKSQSRWYLAITQQLQGDHRAALATAQPLVDEVLAAKTGSELADAVVLQADSLLQTQQLAPAITAATWYLDHVTQGRQRPRALSLLAIAQAMNMQPVEAEATWNRLAKEAADSPYTNATLLRLAQIRDEEHDWKAAAQLYEQLTGRAMDDALKMTAWRGLGYACFQGKDYPKAAAAYGELETLFPNDPLAVEAAYFHAESLREAGEQEKAIEAFSKVVTRYAPMTAAPPESEQSPPLMYPFRAALQQARTYKSLGQIGQADQAFAALFEKFPKPRQLDRLLDEWALLNYEAERFDRADAIFRRLIEEVPDSDLADNAKLSLAESDLIANRLTEARALLTELKDSPQSDAGVRERAYYQLLVLALEEEQWPAVLQLGSDFRAAFPKSESLAYVDYAAAEAVLADPLAPAERLRPLVTRLEGLMANLPPESEAWAPRLWILTAEIQFRLKDYDKIPAIVVDLKAKQPSSPLTYQAEEIWGRALKQQARFPEAREVLERVIADPAAFRTETAAKSQFLIAETWFLQEKWKEAFLAYQQVYASYAFPEWQAAALLQSGKCDEQLGERQDAIATYDRLIKEFPTSSHVAEARRRLEQAKRQGAS